MSGKVSKAMVKSEAAEAQISWLTVESKGQAAKMVILLFP